MANNEEARVKLTITQINKLKSAAKNTTGAILRITKKNFQDEQLPHQLFLTARQKTKTKNVFAKNMLMDKKLSPAHLAKIIQSGGFLSNMGSGFANLYKTLGKKTITDLAAPLAKDVLSGLASNMASNVTSKSIDKLANKLTGQGTVRAGKGFTLFISNDFN